MLEPIFAEAFVPKITGATVPSPAGTTTSPPVNPALLSALTLLPQTSSAGPPNARYGVTFGSLVPGGFFQRIPTTSPSIGPFVPNNPGALNFLSWQKLRKGYVGVTQPDNSPDHNVTTVYHAPEHGTAAWYHFAVLYAFPGGSFTLEELARRYAGSTASAAVLQTYIAGWNHWLYPPIAPNTPIVVTDLQAMLRLAKAMFSHEAGTATQSKMSRLHSP